MLLSILFLIVVTGWLAYLATSPAILQRIHKITGQTPLFFVCAWSLRVGNFHTARLVQIGQMQYSHF